MWYLVVSFPDICLLSYFVGGVFHFKSNFNSIFCKQIVETDQMSRSVASDLCLHCLSMSHKKDAMLIG